MSLTGKTCSLTLTLIKKVKNFDKIILNILTNDGPFRTITCNDRDPPWLKDKIKTLIEEKMKYYNNLGSKLSYTHTHCKTYWSLLKTLINGRRVQFKLVLNS